MKKTLKKSLTTSIILVLLQGCVQIEPQITKAPKQESDIVVTEEPLAPSIKLVNYNIDKPMYFRPFNKSKKNKYIYFSYLGLTLDTIDIKNKIIDNLKSIGYNLTNYPKKANLYVSIYLLGSNSKSSSKDVNYIEDKSYSFTVIMEQHIPYGKTKLAENYNINAKKSAKKRQTNSDASLTVNNADNVHTSRTTMSDDGIGLSGWFNGNKTKVSGGGHKKIEKKNTNILSVNHRSIQSETTLKYYLFREEVNIEANFNIINMQGQNKKIDKIISDKISYRLAKLFDF